MVVFRVLFQHTENDKSQHVIWDPLISPIFSRTQPDSVYLSETIEAKVNYYVIEPINFKLLNSPSFHKHELEVSNGIAYRHASLGKLSRK